VGSRYKRLIGSTLLGLLAVVSAVAWSRAQPNQAAPRARAVVWHQIGSFSGHGSSQTESFTSDTGTLRVTWETSAPASQAAVPFRLTAHSAISGRPLQQVVESTGAGSGVGYVQQDPHVFYMVVDAKDLNWKFTVEEAVAYQ
jgi:hypothetical protein